MFTNLNWAQFEIFNDNRTEAFEEMCKDSWRFAEVTLRNE